MRIPYVAGSALQIRPQQMEEFSQAVLNRFEDWMVANLKQFFPAKTEELGHDALRSLIRHGVERAKTYGITSGPDICRYIHVMAAFGHDFDVDRRLPWAAAALLDTSLRSPSLRVERLYQAAMHCPPLGD